MLRFFGILCSKIKTFVYFLFRQKQGPSLHITLSSFSMTLNNSENENTFKQLSLNQYPEFTIGIKFPVPHELNTSVRSLFLLFYKQHPTTQPYISTLYTCNYFTWLLHSIYLLPAFECGTRRKTALTKAFEFLMTNGMAGPLVRQQDEAAMASKQTGGRTDVQTVRLQLVTRVLRALIGTHVAGHFGLVSCCCHQCCCRPTASHCVFYAI